MHLNIKKKMEEYYNAKKESYTPEQRELCNRMREIISRRSAYAFGFSAGAYFVGIWDLPWAIGFFVVFVFGSALTLEKIDSVVKAACSLYLSIFFLSWFFDGDMKKTVALPLALLCYLFAKRSCPALMQSVFEFFESNLLGRTLTKNLRPVSSDKVPNCNAPTQKEYSALSGKVRSHVKPNRAKIGSHPRGQRRLPYKKRHPHAKR